MTAIAVTGVSGALGRLVAEALESSSGVTRVVGVDVADPAYATRNLEFYRMDVRSESLNDALVGCDAVVHLAFSRAVRDPHEVRNVNVEGTRNLLLRAAEAGVERVVCASSTMAYGAHPDNDFPLTEESPLRACPDLGWSSDPAEMEEIVEAYRESDPGVAVAVMRLAPVVGPRSRRGLGALFEAPVQLSVQGYNPALQVIHERDAAGALVFAVEQRLDGIHNAAADGWLPLDRAAELLGRPRVDVPREQLGRILETLYTWGLADVPQGVLPFLMYPCVAAGDKLRSAGFAASMSAEATLLDFAEARRGLVSLGRLRFRPRNVAAVAGAAVLAGAIVARQIRRRLTGPRAGTAV